MKAIFEKDAMRRSALSAVLVVASCLSMAAAQQSAGPVVKVTAGEVQGRTDGSGAVFKGIAFAAPPVGELRWREPQAVKSWTGVRQAAQYGNACPQGVSDWNKAYATTASEDCLYLNVFTAEWPAKTKKPVMMWIHGGGNYGGSAIGNTSNEPPFDGAGLTPHGVLLVTVHYRLGPFGFIGHPELTAESAHQASGNYGILDLVAALQWIHDNIDKFGGDPNSVTIFGQSAGAVNSAYLVASPLSKGLVHRAILESGTTMVGFRMPPPRSELERQGKLLGEVLNAPTLAALRKVPAADILKAMPEYNKRLQGYAVANTPTDVGVDGYALPDFAPEIYRSGKEWPIPMIIGVTGHEGGYPLFFRLFGNGVINGSPEQVSASVKRVIESVYGKYPDLLARAQQVYGATGALNTTPADPLFGPVQVQLGTDLSMRCAGIQTAAWHSAVAPAYHYEFTRGDKDHPPIHTAELKYVFGHLLDWDSGQQAKQFATAMQKYWTNFAKTGDPNGPGVPNWPKYDTKTRQSMDFSNAGPVVKTNLRSEQCALYSEKLNRDLAARKGQ